MSYKSQKWTALQTTNLIGSEYKLTVTGEIEVLKSNEEPHLAEAKPQGINPTELILELAVAGEGEIGGHVVLWKPVSFEKAISANGYHTVMIRQESGPSEAIKVEKALS